MEEKADDVELLWRLSRALIHLSLHHQQNEEKEEEKQLLAQATEHAQRALELDDQSWQVHQWYAIAIGSTVKFEGTQAKINRGHEYKVHKGQCPVSSLPMYLCMCICTWMLHVLG